MRILAWARTLTIWKFFVMVFWSPAKPVGMVHLAVASDGATGAVAGQDNSLAERRYL